jgi:MFS family permease
VNARLTTDPPAGLIERDVLVRRNARLLMLALGAMQATFPVMLVVAGPAAKDITGNAGSVGVLAAVYFVAVAAGAATFGRWMDRSGRKPGLVASAVIVGVAGIGCAVAIAAGTYAGLLVAAVPFGVASGGANLTRGAVADMYPPERRGRAVGLLLAVGTIGAVGSPLVVALLQDVAEGAGAWDPMVLPWIIVPVAAVVALSGYVAVRPDPRDLAVAVEEPDGPSRPARELLRIPAVHLGVLAAAVGQIAMVGVMTVTPTALHDHGHGSGAISVIISAHITGMFAFGPFIGAAMDRFGRRAGLLAGFVASIVGALLAATEASALAVGAGLGLIGLGWSATYLGATAVISDATDAHERATALGSMDLVVGAVSATAGLVGGFALELAGYGWLGIGVAAVVGLALIPVSRFHEPLREPAGGPVPNGPRLG